MEGERAEYGGAVRTRQRASGFPARVATVLGREHERLLARAHQSVEEGGAHAREGATHLGTAQAERDQVAAVERRPAARDPRSRSARCAGAQRVSDAA